MHEQQLLAIISLMIGMFGATISVIVVTRRIGEMRVRRNLDAAEAKIADLQDWKAGKATLDNAECYRRNIAGCRAAFTIITLVPIIVFGVWIFLTSFYVSLSGDCKELFIFCDTQDSQTTNTKQTTKSDSPDESATQALIDEMCGFVETKLFSSCTVLIVTLIHLLSVFAAIKFVRRANYKEIEIEKLHTTVKAQKEQLEKTSSASQ